MTFNAPNRNRFWADLLVEELIRSGVDFFCLAPGSRSTPLTTAVAAHPKARALLHFDERGAAFCALGYARATGRPAVWMTTSGTAVANGLPAVVEAANDGVPLLLVTADRPPELRDTGTNQTIDQVKIFGGYVRWQFELPVPADAVDPSVVLTTVDHAVHRACRPAQPGPVHLNCMFREPLAPDAEPWDAGVPPALALWKAGSSPFTRYAVPAGAPSEVETAPVWHALRQAERGLVVAGRLAHAAQGAAVRNLAEALGWPLLADIASQVRLGMPGPTQVVYYDQVLASAPFREAHPPDAVLYVGGLGASKRLLQFIEQSAPTCFAVLREDGARFDPIHRVTHRIEARIEGYCAALAALASARLALPVKWPASWRAADDRVAACLDEVFADTNRLTEPLVARLIAQHLPAGHGLCLASSMPVRDMDMYAPPGGAPARVAVNRGASGIDGTVATAAGFTEGLQAPVTLVIGDLALLHDLNSLALLRDRPVVVVVVNNDGGGIFSFLPIARHTDVFEPYFGTPHGLTFAAAAALFGLAYHHPETPEAFLAAYVAACGRPAATLMEVTTNRKSNHALHQDLLTRVVAAVG